MLLQRLHLKCMCMLCQRVCIGCEAISRREKLFVAPSGVPQLSSCKRFRQRCLWVRILDAPVLCIPKADTACVSVRCMHSPVRGGSKSPLKGVTKDSNTSSGSHAATPASPPRVSHNRSARAASASASASAAAAVQARMAELSHTPVAHRAVRWTGMRAAADRRSEAQAREAMHCEEVTQRWAEAATEVGYVGTQYASAGLWLRVGL